jgi:release factor glutamine methyltransferase
MNSRTLLRTLVARITLDEPISEKEQLASLAIQYAFGISSGDVLLGKSIDPGDDAMKTLEEVVDRLNRQEPIQYIAGKAAFYGRDFLVTPAVLIPRPETEELVGRVLGLILAGEKHSDLRVMDVGTGSGCIAITIALALENATVVATDVDVAALKVAAHNARTLGARVQFILHDILKEALPSGLDVIVSNPPYIAFRERHTMRENVLNHEPHRALFVDDDDPFIFYRLVAERSRKALKPGGLLAVEINERFGHDVADIFGNEGFSDVSVAKDIFYKDRIVTGFLR